MNARPDPARRPKRRRLLKFLAAALLGAGIVAAVIAGHIAPRAILQPPRSGQGVPVPDGIAAATFTLPDGTAIHAWIARPGTEPKAVVFVLHGIADSKASQAGTIRFLAGRGIAGIAIDLRAHGDSGGEFATYGALERHDLSHLLDAVGPEFPGIPIGLWGTSYGGAVAIQTMAIDPRFGFGIVESTFASLPDIARERTASVTGLRFDAPVAIALARAGKVASFVPGDISPERAVQSIAVPLLHLHGDSDEVIPFAHAERIRNSARGGNYRFVPIHGGTHYHLREGDPERYAREIGEFLDRIAGGLG